MLAVFGLKQLGLTFELKAAPHFLRVLGSFGALLVSPKGCLAMLFTKLHNVYSEQL
jgi:hypothetical protein